MIKEDEKDLQDAALWHQVTQDVRPLPREHRHPAGMHISAPPPRKRRASALGSLLPPNLLLHDAGSAHSKQRISRKQGRRIKIEATLDLHGYTQIQAQQALEVFCHKARLHGKIWIHIITGKGALTNDRTLRKLLPQWLDQIPSVVAYTSARPCHGGEGAFYVRLLS